MAWHVRKRVAGIDANPELYGLPNFRQHVTELPDSEDAAIEHALGILNVPSELTSDFLHRELMSVSGWSAYATYQDRQGLGHQFVRQLLAIRLAYDTALLALDKKRRCEITLGAPATGFAEAKYIALLATEHAFRSDLVRKLRKVQSAPVHGSRKALQAVFCITSPPSRCASRLRHRD